MAALSSFKKAVVCPLDPNRPEYQAGNDNAEIAIKAYREFEEALDSLPAPTAVVCKTANRASAVLAAYKVLLYCTVYSPCCCCIDLTPNMLYSFYPAGSERKLDQRAAAAVRIYSW